MAPPSHEGAGQGTGCAECDADYVGYWSPAAGRGLQGCSSEAGEILAEFQGEGIHELEVTTFTRDQRDSVRIQMYRDTNGDGALDCDTERAVVLAVEWETGHPTRVEVEVEGLAWAPADEVLPECIPEAVY